MRFTLSWLKQHLQTEASAEKISQTLSSIGLEVDEVIDKSALYQDFIVAKILECRPHPDADKLNVCSVDNGNEVLQIVCGAPNARAGITVVLAPVGTLMPDGSIKIKKSQIRGVQSSGMLCSEQELLLGEDSDGIMELSKDVDAGVKFIQHYGLGDVVFDIDITPNRGDAANVYGIARDLAAAGIGRLKDIPEYNDALDQGYDFPFPVLLEDMEGCHSISFRHFKGLDNSATGSSVSKHLEMIGCSRNTPIVDVSNVTMFSYGRPNHAYDADKIKGSIIIRKSSKGDKFVALGGDEYNLPAGITVICDDEKVLSVAGVMGGELSKVDENTKNIVFELAHFPRKTVINSGRVLNISTDSRFRFERHVDYGLTNFVMKHFTQMIEKECGGTKSKVATLEGKCFSEITSVEFDIDIIRKISGADVPTEKVEDILASLGFVLKEGDKGKYSIEIPTYRQGDIQGEADIVEEVLRIYGYDHLDGISITGNVQIERDFRNKARSLLISRSMNEVVSWSFMCDEDAKAFGFEDNIEIANPISSKMSVMRQSIIPNLLNITTKNMARNNINLSFFEIGNIYSNGAKNHQEGCISGMRSGIANSHNPHDVQRNYDFFDVKADMVSLLEAYGLKSQKISVVSEAPSYFHPGRRCAFKMGKNIIGHCGQLHPAYVEDVSLRDVMAFELFIDNLPKMKKKHSKGILQVSDYQPVERDFAFILDENVLSSDVMKVIQNTSKLIESVKIFDVYKGKGVEDGKKSLALHIRIQPVADTLSEVEIETLCNNIIESVKEKCGGGIRA